jgi:hypothetical protein
LRDAPPQILCILREYSSANAEKREKIAFFDLKGDAHEPLGVNEKSLGISVSYMDLLDFPPGLLKAATQSEGKECKNGGIPLQNSPCHKPPRRQESKAVRARPLRVFRGPHHNRAAFMAYALPSPLGCRLQPLERATCDCSLG